MHLPFDVSVICFRQCRIYFDNAVYILDNVEYVHDNVETDYTCTGIETGRNGWPVKWKGLCFFISVSILLYK